MHTSKCFNPCCIGSAGNSSSKNAAKPICEECGPTALYASGVINVQNRLERMVTQW